MELNGSIAGGEIVAKAGVVTINGAVGAKTQLTVDGGEIVIATGATIDPSVKASVSSGTLRVQKDVTIAGLYVDKNSGRVVCDNGAKLTVSGRGLSIIVR